MTVQEFVNIDKDLQTVQDISDVNIIILIYYLLNMYYLYLCICTSAKCMSVELKVNLFISHNFRFSMSLSLSPNSLYRQTTACTEGGGLTREHCTYMYQNHEMSTNILVSANSRRFDTKQNE